MTSVSIIVPTYKRIDQTIRTIKLLLESEGVGTDIGVEIIISDSTPDESLKNAFDTQISNLQSPVSFHYVRPDHEGIAANKNAGARAATHPILIFCDSDMEVENHTVSYAIESLKTHPTAAMVGGVVIWKGGPNDGKKDRPRPEDRLLRRGDVVYTEALYSRFVATYKDIFWSVGGYDEAVFNMRGEGSDLSIRYWRAGYPLTFNESVVVHHVHDVPDAAAVRVNHSEWGIARDLLLLGYKYNMFETDYLSFASTVSRNFSPLGTQGPYRILQGIGRSMDMVAEVKPALDAFRSSDKPVHDFKFLEIFSNQTLFEECIERAAPRLSRVKL